MRGALRDLVWRSTWDAEAYKTIKTLYLESCGSSAGTAPEFQELPQDVPKRFSAVLELLASSIMCGVEALGISRAVDKDMGEYLAALKQDLLKLYADLILEEREYGVPLRPHKIEKLLSMLSEAPQPP